jgi:hypothetical protein
MEQSAIRVLDSLTPSLLPSPTPPSWIPLRFIQATILKPIVTPRIFQGDTNNRPAGVPVVPNVPIVQDGKEIRNRFERLEHFERFEPAAP